MQENTLPILLYYYFDDNDIDLQQQLEKHLAPLRKQNIIQDWHHKRVKAGEAFDSECMNHIKQAAIILFLVSPDFIASTASDDALMQCALQRHHQRETRVLPILLRPSHWQATPFAHLQYLPDNNQPVTLWYNQDAAYCNIVQGIRDVAMHIAHSSAYSIASPPPSQKPRLEPAQSCFPWWIFCALLLTITMAISLLSLHALPHLLPQPMPTKTIPPPLPIVQIWALSAPIHVSTGKCEQHPAQSCPIIDYLSKQSVYALCQAQGEQVSITNYNQIYISTWWTELQSHNGQWGWMSNVYIKGKPKLDGVPECAFESPSPKYLLAGQRRDA